MLYLLKYAAAVGKEMPIGTSDAIQAFFNHHKNIPGSGVEMLWPASVNI